MRKKLLLKTGIALLALRFLSSCQSGVDGKCYIQFELDPPNCGYSYTDNNSSVPYGMVLNTYYETSPGTYTYSYTDNYCSSSSYAYCTNGTYTVDNDPGEKWSGVSNGYLTQAKSGQDRYYTFHINVSTCGLIDYTNFPIKPKDSLSRPISHPAGTNVFNSGNTGERRHKLEKK